MGKRLGIIPYVFAQPLFSGLKEPEGPEQRFELVQDFPSHLAVKLREKKLDAAFLSPIDYAKDYAMYSIVPTVTAASRGESGAAYVLFKENLRAVTSLAVTPFSTSEIVLAHLVFAEKYGYAPAIIPFAGTVEQAFTKADALLCIGDEAAAHRTYPHKLDLVEEWDDIAGLPFVHGMWVARPDALSAEELRAIIDGRRTSEARPGSVPAEVDCMNQFQYDMDDDARAGLAEFFRMAYYHGILPDIPEIRFHPLSDNRQHVAEEIP